MIIPEYYQDILGVLAWLIFIYSTVILWFVLKKANKDGFLVLIPIINIFEINDVAKLKKLWLLLPIIPLILFTLLLITGILAGDLYPAADGLNFLALVFGWLTAIYTLVLAVNMAKCFGMNKLFAVMYTLIYFVLLILFFKTTLLVFLVYFNPIFYSWIVFSRAFSGTSRAA